MGHRAKSIESNSIVELRFPGPLGRKSAPGQCFEIKQNYNVLRVFHHPANPSHATYVLVLTVYLPLP